MLSSRTIVLALVVLLAYPSSASAQETAPSDPLVPTSIFLLAAGAAMATTGGILWGTAHGEEVCGFTGCVTGTNEGEQRDAGTILLGAGAGLAMAGALAVALTVGNPLDDGKTRDDPGVATAGLLITSLSFGMATGALALGGLGREDVDFGRSIPMFVASGVLGAVGIPMLIAGADPETPAQRRAEQEKKAERKKARADAASARRRAEHALMKGPTTQKSPAMLGIGVAILVSGIIGATSLFVAAGTYQGSGFLDLGAIGYAAGGLGCLGVGIGAGLPLIAYGAKRVPAQTIAAPSPPIPVRLTIGAGSVAMDWRF